MPRRAPLVQQSTLLWAAFAVFPRSQALRMQRMRTARKSDWIATLTSASTGLVDVRYWQIAPGDIACPWCERSLPLGVLEDSRAAFAMIASKIFSFRRDEFDTCLAAHRRKSLRQLSIPRPRNVQACLR